MRRHVIAHTNPLRMRVSYILICILIYILIYGGFHGPLALRMHHGADGCGDATNTTNTHGASTLCPMVLFSFCSSRSCCCCRIHHEKYNDEATANAKNTKTTTKLTTSPTTSPTKSRKSTTIRLFQKPPARDKHMHACIRVYADATQKSCGFWRNLQNSMSDTCSQAHAAKQRTHRFCKFKVRSFSPARHKFQAFLAGACMHDSRANFGIRRLM